MDESQKVLPLTLGHYSLFPPLPESTFPFILPRIGSISGNWETEEGNGEKEEKERKRKNFFLIILFLSRKNNAHTIQKEEQL